MNEPDYRAPIPSPSDPLLPPTEPRSSDEWEKAPKIIRSWAYQLAWMQVVILPVAILAAMLGAESQGSLGERIGIGFFYFVVWAASVWQIQGLKTGMPAAWPIQIVLSILGFCVCPCAGIIINIYILSQWFKPETKAWFQRTNIHYAR